MPSGIWQPSSRIALRIVQPAPIFTSGMITERCTLERSSTRTLEKSSDWLMIAPETMQPPETIELAAMPRRPSSLSTNFAGGWCSW